MRKSILSLLAVMLLAVLPAFSAIPYHLGPEGFENGAFPAGWTQENVQGTVNWLVEGANGETLAQPSGAKSGSCRAAIRGLSGQVEGFVTKLITPAINLTQAYQPQLVFSHAQAARAGFFDTLRVYYRVNATAPWQLLEEYSSPIPGWTTEVITLPSSYQQASAYQLAFEATDHAGLGIVLDDISIFSSTQCQDAYIQNIAVSSHGAIISSGCNGAYENFEIVVTSAPVTDWSTLDRSTVVYTVTTDEYDVTISGLNSYQQYYVYVRTDCADNETGFTNWVSATFKTTMLADLPYVQTFETSEAWASNTNFGKPAGWTFAGMKSAAVPYVYKGTSSTYKQNYSVDSTCYLAFVGAASTSIAAIPADSIVYAATPELNGNLADYEIDFWGTAYSYFSNGGNKDYASELAVGVMTDPNDIGTLQIIETVRLDNVYQFKHFRVSLAGYTGTGKYICLASMSNKQNVFFVDNFRVRQVSSPTPTNVRALNVLPTGFTVVPQLNGADSWNLRIAPTYNRDASQIADSLCIVNQTGLTAANYQVQLSEAMIAGKNVLVYVQGVKNGVASEWSMPLSLHVPVSGVTPMSFTFASDEGPTFQVKELINESHYTTATKGYVNLVSPVGQYDNYPTASSGAPVFDGPYLKLNGIDNYVVFPYLNDFNGLEIMFRLSAGSASSFEGAGRVAVGVMTDPYDLSTFTELGRFDAPAGNFGKMRQDLSSYTGNGHFLAIRALSPAKPSSVYGSHNCIDNIRIQALSTCFDATYVSATALATSAILRWTTNGVTNFMITLYNDAAHTQVDTVFSHTSAAGAVTDSMRITGLNPETMYYYSVQAICGTDTLPAEDFYSFKTQVGVPYNAVIPAGNVPTGWTRAVGLLSDAFVRGDSALTSTSSGWANNNNVIVNGMQNPHMVVNIYATSCKYWLISPDVCLDLEPNEAAALTFKAAWTKYSRSAGAATAPIATSTDDKFAVLISTDGGKTWNQNDAFIWANDGTSNRGLLDNISHEGTKITIPLSNYNGQTIRVAFYGESTVAGGDNDLRISEIAIGAIDASCQGMTSLNANETGTSSGEILWSAVGTQEVYLKVTAAGDTTPVFVGNVTTSPLQLTGLQSNTLYQVIGYQTCAPTDTLRAIFRTDCDAYTIEHFATETFTPATSSIDCWKLGVQDTAGVGNTSLTEPEHRYLTAFGDVLYFNKYKNTSSYSYGNNYYAMLPELRIDSINKYQVVFDAATTVAPNDTTAARQLYVGILTNPQDFSTLEITDTINLVYAEDSAHMKTYAIGFDNYIGDYMGDYGKYIVFRVSAPADKSAIAIVDNVRIEPVIGCHQVIDLEALTVTNNTVILDWSSKDATTFEVAVTDTFVRNFNDIPNFTYRQIVTGSRDSITVLAANTLYYAYVRAICGAGDTSVWSSATQFHTECDPITSFPWVEDFSGSANLGTEWDGDCWINEHIAGSGSQLFKIDSIGAGNTTRHLKLPDMSSGTVTRLGLPYMSLPEEGDYDFCIDVYRNSSYSSYNEEGLMIVCESDQGVDTIGFVPRVYSATGLNVPAVPEEGWYTYAFRIPYSGNINISIYGHSRYGAATSFDNLVVRVAETCPAPTGLVVDSVDYASAYMHWTSEMVDHVVEVATDNGFSDVVATVNVTADTVATISGLAPYTTYYARVRRACDSTKWSIRASFFTRAAIPFVERFKSTAWTPDWVRWTGDIFTGQVSTTTSGWNRTASAGAGMDGHVYANAYVYTDSYSGSKTLYNYSLITPQVTLEAPEAGNNIILSFDLAFTTSSTSTAAPAASAFNGHTFAMAITANNGTSWMMDSTWLWKDSVIAQVPATTTHFEYDLTSLAGQSVRILFYNGVDSTAGSSAVYANLDNIRIEEVNPNCEVPTPAVLSTTTDSLAVGFTYEAGQTTQVQISASETFITVLDSILTQDSVAVFGNLNPATQYYVRVRNVCGVGTTSRWSDPVSEYTACAPISLPYDESFENMPLGNQTAADPICWNSLNVNQGSYPYAYVNNSTSYVKTGSQSLYFRSSSSTDAYMILPEFDAPTHSLRMSFSCKFESTSSGILYVGYMTDISDESSFVNLLTVNRTTAWQDLEVDYTTISAANANARLAFKYGDGPSNNFYLGIDDIHVEGIDTNCLAPNVYILSTTPDSVYAAWNYKVGNNMEAQISEDADFATVLATQYVADSTCVFGNLDPATRYFVRARILCSATDTSEWSVPAVDYTGCEVLSLPYTQDFETLQLGSQTSAAPLCWDMLNANNGTYPYMYVDNTGAYVKDGDQSLFFKSDDSTSVYAILPEVNVATNLLRLQFDCKFESATSSGKLFAGYLMDATDTASFVAVTEITRSTEWQHIKVDYRTIADSAANARVALRYMGVGKTNYYLGVDNILLEVAPDNETLDAVQITNVGRSEMDITWMQAESDTCRTYEVVISTTELTEAELAAAQPIVVTDTNMYHAVGLDRGTTHYVYVRTGCAIGAGFGKWVSAQATTSLLLVCGEELQIGTGTATSNLVFTSWGNTYSQHIYTASELHEMGFQAGQIAGVAFRYNGTSSYDKVQSVYIGTTTASSFVSATAIGNMQLVYGPSVETCTATWKTYNFTENFEWDGVSNIVIGVLTNQSGLSGTTTSSGWSSHGTSISGSYPSIYYYRDGTPIDATSPAGSSYTSAVRPNIKFITCTLGETCPAVTDASVQLLGSGVSEARLSWTASEADYASSYDVFLATVDTLPVDSFVPQYTDISPDSLFVMFTDLDEATTYYAYIRVNCQAYGHNEGSSQWFMQTFTTNANCMPVENLQATLTAKTAADITWTAYSDDENPTCAYIVSPTALDSAAVAAAQLQTVTGTTLSLTNLLYDQEYHVYVATVCGATHSSFKHVAFSTKPTCPSVVNLTGSVSFNMIALDWESDAFGEETAWEVGIVGMNNAQVVSIPSAVFFGLTAETDYVAYVRAICSTTDTSAVDTLAFRTTAIPGNEVQLGNGIVNAYLIFTSYGNSYTQHIYTADELIAAGYNAGQIVSLSFQFSGTSSVHNKIQTIYMGLTQETAFTGSDPNVDFVALTPVYGPEVRTYAAGWQTYELSSPFVWDGVSNIIVGMLSNQDGVSGAGTSTGWQNYGTAQPEDRTIYCYQDNTVIDPDDLSSVTYNGRSTLRPNVRIEFAPEACRALTNLQISNVTTTSATATWMPGSSELSWEMVLSTTPMTNQQLAAASKDTIYNVRLELTDLTVDEDYYLYLRGLCSETEQSSWVSAHFITEAVCKTPLAVEVTDIDAHSARCSWSNGITHDGVTATYEVVYAPENVFDWANIASMSHLTITDTTAALTGLLQNTVYKIAVRAICSNGADSRWTEPINFRTECDPLTVFPWYENFNDYESGADFDVPCFDNFNVVAPSTGNGSTGLLFGVVTTGYGDGSQHLRLPDMRSGTVTRLEIPVMQFEPTHNYAFMIDVMRNTSGTSSQEEGLSIILRNMITGTEQELGFISRNYEVTDNGLVPAEEASDEYTYRFPLPNDGTYRIVIEGHSRYGNATYFDNLAVTATSASCALLTNMRVDNITPNSADVFFSYNGSAGSAKVEIAKDARFKTVVDTIVTVDSVIAVSGLEAGSTYFVRARRECGTGEYGEWNDPISFTINCGIAALPWSEDFEERPTTNFDAPCWVNEHVAGSSTYLYNVVLGTSYGATGKVMMLNDQSAGNITHLVLPQMNFEAGSAYEMSIDVRRYHYSTLKMSEGLHIYASTSDQLTDDAQLLAFIPRENTIAGVNVDSVATEGWYTYRFDVPAIGNGHIIIKGVSEYGNSSYFDNLSIRQIASYSYDAVTCPLEDYSDTYFTITTDEYTDANIVRSVRITGENGAADTIVTINLTVLQTENVVIYDTICEGHLYNRNGVVPFVAKTSTIKPLFLKDINGCDSLVTINIEVLPASRRDTTIFACKGSSVTIGGKQYFNDIVVTDTLVGVNTCDSIVRTFIEFSETEGYTVEQHRIICAGDTYTDAAFPDGISKAGTYTNTVTTAYGCDSTVTIHMSVAANGVAYDTVKIEELPYVYAEDTILGTNVGVGDYTFEVQASCGQVTLHIYVTDGSGSALDNVKVLQLSVAPNPAVVGEPIEILSQVSMAADFRLMVFDAIGQLVYSATDGSLTIPGLPVAGYYTVRLTSGGQSYQAKLLVK